MNELPIDIVPIGGRIKAAAVGMDVFDYEDTNDLNEHLNELRKKPPLDILKAFFPSSRERMKQLMRTFGLYRPTLKTDQGTAGFFTSFGINTYSDSPPSFSRNNRTYLGTQHIIDQECIAIPEPHYDHDLDIVLQVQEAFKAQDFHQTDTLLQGMETRRADKGRTPFFFIRLARTEFTRIFKQDVVHVVQQHMRELLSHAIDSAQYEERKLTGSCSEKPPNLVYVQPDAYITPEGDVHIEKINCPDVGMFLSSLDIPPTTTLPAVSNMMADISSSICHAILRTCISSNGFLRDKVYLVTRDGVLRNQEDILEQRDMEIISHNLTERIATHPPSIEMVGVSQVRALPDGAHAILMNIDYTHKGVHALFDRHTKGEISCYPNPFLQRILQHASGLQELAIEPGDTYREDFLQRAESLAQNPRAVRDKIRFLTLILDKYGMESDIIHAYVGNECIPILTRCSHSWRVFAVRCKRYPNETIRLRAIPLSPTKSLLESESGKHMHVYRFLATARDQ